MLFEELRASLKTSIAPAYVMTGGDVFLINKSVDLILTAANIDKLNVVRLEEGAKPDEVNAHLQNVSMFGGANAVVIRGEDTRVFLKPLKDFKDAQKVDCNPMSEPMVVRLIMQDKRFDLVNATMLARMCECNYSRVNNEMQKIIANGCFNNIEQVVTKTEKFQVYELANAVIKRDATRAQKILDTLTQSGMEDYAIFGNLVAFARRLFYCVTSKAPDAEVAKFLGVNPYAVTATRRDARSATKMTVCEIYERALELEYQIKGGYINAGRACVLLVGAML